MEPMIVIGNLEFVIDKDEMLASLVFSPNTNGIEWNNVKIGHYLTENGLSGISMVKINSMVHNFINASGRVVEILARGNPPEPPKPQTPKWFDLKIPPEAEQMRLNILSKASPPHLEFLYIKKVPVKKLEEKQSVISFIKSKKVDSVEYLEQEIREPAYVDTSVIKIGYAKRGDQLCLLSDPVAGKSGRTVFGKSVPPTSPDNLLFALGSGIIKKGNMLIAGNEGFIRIGAQWADIIPFSLHEWEINFVNNMALLNFIPGDSALPIPDAEEIYSRAMEIAGDKNKTIIPANKIAMLLANSVRSGKQLVNVSLGESNDSIIKILVSEDKMLATIQLIKSTGTGKPLEWNNIEKTLDAQGFSGLDKEHIKKDIMEFLSSEKQRLIDYELIKGIEPQQARERNIIWQVAFIPGADAEKIKKQVAGFPDAEKLLPSLAAWPLSNDTRVAFVRESQTIYGLSDPFNGKDGQDIYGSAIFSKKSREPVILSYENIKKEGESANTIIDGILFHEFFDNAHRIRVIPFRNPSLEIIPASDSMSATISINPGLGFAEPLATEDVIKALKSEGICYGINPGDIESALSTSAKGETVSKVCVVSGKQPVKSEDPKMEWIIKTASGNTVTIRPDGTADFRNQDRFTDVPKDTPLLDILAAGTKGQDGIDIYGRPLKCENSFGNVQLPTWDESIRAEKTPDGKIRLCSNIDGELHYKLNRIYISPLHSINGDVGPRSGNVKFSGTVRIDGNVLSGYTINSGGDIIVGGLVENAILSADGMIFIKRGIKGGKRGILRARKTISLLFAEQAKLLAVEDIKIYSSCLHCEIKTNGHIIIAGNKGALIGGTICTKKGLDVFNLGSENGIKTLVSFGQDYLLAEQIKNEEKEIEKLKLLMIHTNRKMSDLESTGADLAEVRSDKLKILKLIDKRTMRLFSMREKLEEHFPSEIRIRGNIFQNVTLESHGRTLEIDSRKQKIVYFFNPENGRILSRPLT